jgi:hypothetical protein
MTGPAKRQPPVLLQRLRGGGAEDNDDDTLLNADIANMALVLRWTAEINRRLQTVGASPTVIQQDQEEGPLDLQQVRNSMETGSSILRGGGGADFAYRIRDSSGETESLPLTVFHAKAPRVSNKDSTAGILVGVQRWGPELTTYIRHIQTRLELSSLDLILAMIYLDRACSVETPRSDGSPSLPFCSPRTLHRSILAALIVTKQANYDRSKWSLENIHSQLQSLGIPMEQMQEMVYWTRRALGDAGLFVSSDQMSTWERTWKSRFPGSSSSRIDTNSSPATTSEDAYIYTQANVRYHNRASGVHS